MLNVSLLMNFLLLHIEADFQRDVLTHNKKLNFPDSIGIMPSPPVKVPPQVRTHGHVLHVHVAMPAN